MLTFFDSAPNDKDMQEFEKSLTDSESDKRSALEYFFKKVESSEDKDVTKKQLFAIFVSIGNSSALVLEYRKKLSRLIF